MLEEKELVEIIAAKLKARSYFLATAESCTGGLLGHLITNLSGSSDFYLGGQITYSNEAKKDWLGVPQEILANHGAVSKETVVAMAKGIRRAFSQTIDIKKIIGISISGIAGPTGGTSNKPIGTVWFGLSMDQKNIAFDHIFKGDRESIKRQAALGALRIIQDNID